MPTFELAALAEACGGRLMSGDAAQTVTSYAIDTRKLEPGGVFFALRGERTDGHRFLGEARDAGASVAVVERTPDDDDPAPPGVILVDDTRAAMTRCAHAVRERFDAVRWIAVTGSNGKTTTKEMIAAGLATGGRVHRTPGNYNNHLGVPLTLLAMPDDAEIAVIELAMNHAGEIAELTGIVRPDIGLVTNVRSVHMASFRSIDDVAAAKGELFALLADEAISVVFLDDMQVRVQAARHVGPRVTFGMHADADVRALEITNTLVPGASLTCRIGERTLRLQLSIGGAHSAFNALAALATVVAAGGDPAEAAPQIERVEAVAGRGRTYRLHGDVLLVDDSYNSSPPALASVLDTMQQTAAARKVLVLGDMLELGPMEGPLHGEAGRRAGAAGVDLLIGVGTLAREAVESARRAGVGLVHHFKDSEIAARELPEYIRGGDLVVVKGSRGVRMGRIVRAVIEARRAREAGA